MYVIAIDDLALETLGIPPALITSESEDLQFVVRRREGSRSSLFVGGSPEPAIWNVLFRTPNSDTRALLLAMLTSRLDFQRRLVARRTDAAGTLVSSDAAIYAIRRPNELDLSVDFEGTDSIWTMERPVLSGKTFASPRDLALTVDVPGASRTTALFALTPLAQRTSGTAAVGSRYRRRYRITNTADEPMWRYPLRVDLGDTAALVGAGKALASGNDLRLWIDGLEQSRTLVGWNTAATALWFILPVLLPNETLVIEVVYGNPVAGAAPQLSYPDLPPFTLSASSNALWDYPVNPVGPNVALGGWYLSKGTEGATADFSVPGAWRPAATLGNPDNVDAVVQLRASQFISAGIKYQAVFDALRAVADSTVVLAVNPFDGVSLHNPLGIVSIRCDFRFVNMGGVGALVILARDSASEGWERLYTNPSVAASQVIVAIATYAPGAPVKHLAFANWPSNLVAVPEETDPALFSRFMWYSVLQVAIDSSKISIAPVLEDAHPWTPADLGGTLRGWFPASSIAGVADGGAVALWPDASGAAAHARQSSAGIQPTYRAALLNGLPGVDFTPAQHIDTPLSASNLTETVIAVVRLDAAAGTSHLLEGSATAGREWQIISTRQQRFARRAQGTKATSTALVPLGTPVIIAGTLATPTSTFAVSGTAESAATAGASTVAGLTTLIGSGFDGVIFDLVVAAPQSAANLDRLFGYLAHRYGVTGALPGGHPYKAAAPQIGATAEVEIYELATELRLGGGNAPPVAPYNALLIGNARNEDGAGTPRCAVALTQTLLVDGETRSHGIWPATLTTKIEDVSAHAVRAVVGWDDGGTTVEGLTSEWVPLIPGLAQLPASDFQAGLDGWVIERATSGMAATLGWDGDVGGEVAGSLAMALASNVAGAGAELVLASPRVLPTGGRDAVALVAWMRTSNVNLVPRLLIRFLDRDGAVLTDVLEPLWVPLVDEPVRRPLAARVPERAASWRYGVLITAVTAGATGTVWLDDVRPNASDLIVVDIASGSLAVEVATRGRWVW